MTLWFGEQYICSFTALSDAQGNFLLNGGFVVSMLKEEINIQGALFEYSVSNNSIERINSTDRLEEELVLQVTLWWSVRLCFNHVSELQWLST